MTLFTKPENCYSRGLDIKFKTQIKVPLDYFKIYKGNTVHMNP